MRTSPKKIAQYLLKENRLVVFTLGFLVVFSFASYALASFYPGQTNDPGCAPTDITCFVATIPDVTGHAGQYLTTDGTSTSWTASLPGSGIATIDSDSTTAQTLAVGTSGTDFAIVDDGTGDHTFNLPVASASATGKLSSADWSTFNAKLSSVLPVGDIFVGSASGTAISVPLSGDATITSSGTITVANNAITTAKINAGAVTYSKLQNESALSLLGNATGSAAAPGEITLGSGLSFSGSTLTATGLGGTVTSVGVTSANGVSATGGPITGSGSFTFSLGNITPTSVNGLTLTPLSTGYTIAGGTSTSTTLTVANNASVSGTNTGDQTITLTGQASGSGTGTFAVTLDNNSVIAKTLTGYASATGTVTASDSIVGAIGKLNGNISALSGSTLAIGNAVGGATPNTVPFVDASGNLQDVGSPNGTLLSLNDAGKFLSFSSSGSTYLNFDALVGVYAMGDLSGTANHTTLNIDDATQTTVFSGYNVGPSYGDTLSLDGSTGVFEMGDVSGVGNSTYLDINDASSDVSLSGNQAVSTSDVAANITFPALSGGFGYSGSGLNDMTLQGAYDDASSLPVTITVVIDSLGGGPHGDDTFDWSDTNGNSGGPIEMTDSPQLLENGVYVTFSDTTGHSSDDTWVWDYTAGGSVGRMADFNGQNYSYLIGDIDNTFKGEQFGLEQVGGVTGNWAFGAGDERGDFLYANPIDGPSGGLYWIGDEPNTNHGTYLGINDLNQRASLFSDYNGVANSALLQVIGGGPSGGTVQIGDVSDSKNGTVFAVNDSREKVTSSGTFSVLGLTDSSGVTGVNDLTFSGGYSGPVPATYSATIDPTPALLLDYDTLVGTFTVGDSITDGTDTGTILAVNMLDSMLTIETTGTFSGGTLTDTTSSATANNDGSAGTVDTVTVTDGTNTDADVPLASPYFTTLDGVTIDAGSTTGHTAGDVWTANTTSSSGTTFKLDSSAGTFGLGDLDASGNDTTLVVNDVGQTIVGSAKSSYDPDLSVTSNVGVLPFSFAGSGFDVTGAGTTITDSSTGDEGVTGALDLSEIGTAFTGSPLAKASVGSFFMDGSSGKISENLTTETLAGLPVVAQAALDYGALTDTEAIVSPEGYVVESSLFAGSAYSFLSLDSNNDVYGIGDLGNGVGGHWGNGTNITVDDNSQQITFNGNYSFPFSDGSVGQTLVTDGSGNVSWQTPAELPTATNWTGSTNPTSAPLANIAYGNGLFVAVGLDSVLTSPDGINWTSQTPAASVFWNGIAYGNGLFVATAQAGFGATTANDIMISPDGVHWTSETSTVADSWYSIAYGNGVFVAVSFTGDVMTSPDGITWTSQTPATASMSWRAVTYGNGLFVAVAYSGSTTTDVMTSPDGVTWTSGSTSTAAAQWSGVAYGHGVFIAVAQNGDIMTTGNPTTGAWTSETSPSVRQWIGVTYGNGFFVTTALDGTTANDIAISSDAVTWSSETSPAALGWQGLAYGNGVFVGVAGNAVSNNIMTSGILLTSSVQNNNMYQGGITVTGDITFPSITPGSSCNSSTDAVGYTSTGLLVCNTSVSDQRLKADITPLDTMSGLTAIEKLAPVSYYWKDTNLPGTGSTAEQFGFIAQDVQQVLPNLVTENPPTYLTPDVTYGLNYQGLTVVAIQAIKELDLKVEPLTSIDPTVNGSLAQLMLQFLENAVVTIENLTVGTLTVSNEVCSGSVCVTQAQFQNLLLQAGGTVSTPPPAVTPPPSDDSSGDSSSSDTSSSTPTSDDGSSATSTPTVSDGSSSSSDTASSTPASDDSSGTSTSTVTAPDSSDSSSGASTPDDSTGAGDAGSSDTASSTPSGQ